MQSVECRIREMYETPALNSALLDSALFTQIGGSPRCCPVLCGLRDRCIAAMLATLMPVRKDRDTKADPALRDAAARSVKSWPTPRFRVAENETANLR